MPDLVEDIEIYPRMVALAGALEEELKSRGLPGIVAVVPEGIAVLDYFGDDCEGFAWVRLAGAFAYSAFPQPEEYASCASLMAWQLELGYAHCAPPLGEDGSAPTPTEQVSAARVQTSAMIAMRDAIRRVLHDDDDAPPYALGNYVADIAGGGALGATWTVTVGDRIG